MGEKEGSACPKHCLFMHDAYEKPSTFESEKNGFFFYKG